MLRATSSGFSGAFDPWGRMLGMTDHFSGATLISQVQFGGVRTLYSYIGDPFAWLCVVSLMAAIVAAIRTRVALVGGNRSQLRVNQTKPIIVCAK